MAQSIETSISPMSSISSPPIEQIDYIPEYFSIAEQDEIARYERIWDIYEKHTSEEREKELESLKSRIKLRRIITNYPSFNFPEEKKW